MCDLEIIDALKLEKQTRFWFCFLCFCSQCSVKCSKLENEISFRKRSFIFQRLLHSTRFNWSYECLILPHEIKSRNRHFLGGNRSNSKVEIFQTVHFSVCVCVFYLVFHSFWKFFFNWAKDKFCAWRKVFQLNKFYCLKVFALNRRPTNFCFCK